MRIYQNRLDLSETPTVRPNLLSGATMHRRKKEKEKEKEAKER